MANVKYRRKSAKRDKKRKRVVAYIRVSTADQTDNFSLEAQKRSIRKFCEQEGWELVHIYVDAGQSAWLRNADSRPSYLRLMADVEKDKFDIVATHSIDRMSRSISNMFNTLDKFSEYGIEFVSVSERNFNFSGPQGRAVMAVIVAFAEVYSSFLSFNSKKGMRERVQQGIFLGRPPFGYQLCDEMCPASHNYCHPNERKARIVNEIFERYASGVYTMQEIATWVNSRGFSTNGYFAERRKGKSSNNRFSLGSISGILDNPFYMGQLLLRDEEDEDKYEYVPAVHEPIVSEQLFEKVQARRSKNWSNSFNPQGRRSTRGHLLAKIAKCYECGGNVSATTQGTQKKETYYRMDERSTGPVCRFTRKSLKGMTLDSEIHRLLSDFKLQDDWREYVMETLQSNMDISDVDDIERQKRNLQERIRRTNESYRHLLISKAEHNREIAGLELEKASLEIPEYDDVTRAGQLLEDFGSLWSNATTSEQNKLARAVFDAVYIDFGERRIHSLQPKSSFAGLFRKMASRDDLGLEEAPGMLPSRESDDLGAPV